MIQGTHRLRALGEKLAQAAVPRVLEETFRVARAAGVAASKELQLRARANPPPGLADWTLREKADNDSPFPTRTWMDTGFATDNMFLGPKVRETRRGFTVSVLVSDRPHNQPGRKDNDHTIRQVVNWLERGRSSAGRGGPQPARPVFEPFREEMMNDDSLRQDIHDAARRAIVEAIQ